MALPAEYLDVGSGDLRMRIGNSIIKYKDDPAFVCSGVGDNIRLLLPSLKAIRVSKRDPDLSVDNLGSHIGYMDDEQGFFRLMRVPRRAFCQGLNLNNTSVTLCIKGSKSNGRNRMYAINRMGIRMFDYESYSNQLNGGPSRKLIKKVSDAAIEHDANETLLYLMSRPAFIQMWRNKYPSLRQQLSKAGGNYCLSRRYYIDTHTGNTPLLCHAGGRIGQVKRGKVVYDKDRMFLSGDVHRTIGLSAQVSGD